MKHQYQRWLIVPLLILSLFLQACPFGGKDIKVTDLVVAARIFAGAPRTLQAIKDIADTLSQDGTISAAVRDEIKARTDKVKRSIDELAGSVEAGKFDALSWDNALAVIEGEFASTLALFGKAIDPRVSEIVRLANILVPNIRKIIKQLKPPPAPATPLLDKAGKDYRRGTVSITPGQILTIAIIVTVLGGELLLIRSETDASKLWTLFHENSQAYR